MCDRIHDPTIALGERIIMWELFLQQKLSDSVKKSLQGTHLSEGDPQYRVKFVVFHCITLHGALATAETVKNHEITENRVAVP